MIKYFSAVYAQSVSGGHFKSFSHHKEHNGIGWRTNTAGEERRHGGRENGSRWWAVMPGRRQQAARWPGQAMRWPGPSRWPGRIVILLPLPLDESPHPSGTAAAGGQTGGFCAGRAGCRRRRWRSPGRPGWNWQTTLPGRNWPCTTPSPRQRAASASCWQQRTRTLWGAEVLVLGFGPVGQALAVRLSALGAGVTVCARRAGAACSGREPWPAGCPACTALAGLAPAFDTVVNTIPAPVLGERGAGPALRSGSLIVDLASKPGGTDFAAAAAAGTTGPSMPSACRPPARRRRRARRWRVRCRPCCRSGRGRHDDHTEPRNASHLRCAAASVHWKQRLQSACSR